MAGVVKLMLAGASSRTIGASSAGTAGCGRDLATLEGHAEAVGSVAVNWRDSLPANARVASGGEDGQLRLWSLDASNAPTRVDVIYGPMMFVDATNPECWTIRRTDGETRQVIEREGQPPLAADPELYSWLSFFGGDWGWFPVFDVPPEWLQWSEDRREVVIERREYTVEELAEWYDHEFGPKALGAAT